MFILRWVTCISRFSTYLIYSSLFTRMNEIFNAVYIKMAIINRPSILYGTQLTIGYDGKQPIPYNSAEVLRMRLSQVSSQRAKLKQPVHAASAQPKAKEKLRAYAAALKHSVSTNSVLQP